MARLGFKKVYAASSFTTTDVADLFARIKTLVIDAGFSVLLDTSTAIDFVAMGRAGNPPNDDLAHWALTYVDNGSYAEIVARSVYGTTFEDASARANATTILSSNSVANPSPEMTLWFAGDALAGWWWMHCSYVDANSATGVTRMFGAVATSTRRYASDTHQGLGARYGVFEAWGGWHPAYALYTDGSIASDPYLNSWSPFGSVGNMAARRHAGSPLPRMAVPCYPSSSGLSAHILGEYNDVLVITDGYASEEVVVPGWIAMTGNEYDDAFALPAPTLFVSV